MTLSGPTETRIETPQTGFITQSRMEYLNSAQIYLSDATKRAITSFEDAIIFSYDHPKVAALVALKVASLAIAAYQLFFRVPNNPPIPGSFFDGKNTSVNATTQTFVNQTIFKAPTASISIVCSIDTSNMGSFWDCVEGEQMNSSLNNLYAIQTPQATSHYTKISPNTISTNAPAMPKRTRGRAARMTAAVLGHSYTNNKNREKMALQVGQIIKNIFESALSYGDEVNAEIYNAHIL